MLAMIPLTIHVSDTYFIVAHIHYVLFGGSLFTIFAGVYYWFPKMTGRMYDETLGKLHFWMTFIFFNLTFAPMHLIGVQGMPRRVVDYAEQFAGWNLFISIASFMLGLSTLDLRLQHDRLVARRPARARPTRGARSRSSGRSPRRRRSSTSTPSRPSSAARTSTASRARCTASSRAAREVAAARGRRDAHRASEGVGRDAEDDPRRRQPRRSAGRELLDAVARARARQGGHALPPRACRARSPRHGNVIYDDAVRRRRAGAHRPRARRTCATRASRSIGEVGDEDPYTATHGRDRRVPPRRDHHLDAARRRARAGCAATSSSASTTPTGVPVDARRHRPRRSEGLRVRRHARRRQPHRGRRGRCSSACKATHAEDERHALHRRRAAGGRRRRSRRAVARARLRQLLDRDARERPRRRGHDRRPRPVRRDDERAATSSRSTTSSSRRCRRPAPAGCAPTSSSACASASNDRVEHVEVAESRAPPTQRYRLMEAASIPHAVAHDDTTTTARRRPTAARASSPSSSGCCFSSSPRSWSSGPSSRPTSSSGSWQGERVVPVRGLELPVAVAGINTAILLSSSLTMHWAQTSIKNGNRFGPEGGHRSRPFAARARRSSSSRSTSTSTSASRRTTLAQGVDLLRPHRPARRARLHRPVLLLMVTVRAFRGHFSPERAPRRRGAGHLLALRRRHVGPRVLDDLHPLKRSNPAPLRAGDVRALIWVVAVVAVLVVLLLAVRAIF